MKMDVRIVTKNSRVTVKMAASIEIFKDLHKTLAVHQILPLCELRYQSLFNVS